MSLIGELEPVMVCAVHLWSLLPLKGELTAVMAVSTHLVCLHFVSPSHLFLM